MDELKERKRERTVEAGRETAEVTAVLYTVQ